MSSICPLCKSSNSYLYSNDTNRSYFLCKKCDLVYVDRDSLPSLADEKKKYDQHQNSPQNLGYRCFLNRLLTPFKSYIPTNSQGLDFGSGPGPTLSKMFEEDGYKMDIYDIFYAKNEMVFDKIYDFITMSEVIEHIHNLDIELNRVWSILKSGGFLGIMTAFRPTDDEFANWYYKRDLTHVRFFSEKTFRYIAHTLGATIVYIDNGVVILKK